MALKIFSCKTVEIPIRKKYSPEKKLKTPKYKYSLLAFSFFQIKRLIIAKAILIPEKRDNINTFI